MAKFQGKQLKDLFAGFKQPICKFVVDAIDKIQNRNPAAKVSLDVVSEVASVFEFRDVHSFLKVHVLCSMSGFEITAGQRTMSGPKWVLSGQILG